MYACVWLLYSFHLALYILYPLKSAKLFNFDYIRVIYIVELLLTLVIGTTPSIVSATLSKYEILHFPPTLCGNSDTIRFYKVIFPMMICVNIGGILGLLILYKIHVVSLLFMQSLIRTNYSFLIYIEVRSKLRILYFNNGSM